MAEDLTRLLRLMSEGDSSASEELWTSVYAYLHQLAERAMGTDAYRGSIQPTMLVSEAWMRLSGKDVDFTDRRHFYFLASKVMRAVLVDFARKRQARKRGGEHHRVSMDFQLAAGTTDAIDVLVLDETLERLAQHNETMARLVELRFFGGLTHGECAQAMGCSLRVVERNWTFAKAWLYSELYPEEL